MSRIGKKSIVIPAGVKVDFKAPRLLAQGPQGQQEIIIPPAVVLEISDKEIKVKLAKGKVKAADRMQWGTTRALLANVLTGVATGFTEKLEINGVGYRAAVQGQKLTLSLGFSHPVEFAIPIGVTVKITKNIITINGINRQLVGQVAANIRALRKPEPYKGKGIKYAGEHVRRKEMKKAMAEGEGSGK